MSLLCEVFIEKEFSQGEKYINQLNYTNFGKSDYRQIDIHRENYGGKHMWKSSWLLRTYSKKSF